MCGEQSFGAIVVGTRESPRPNSAQEQTRGRSVGPPAEPAKESFEHHGGTPPAAHQVQRRQAACRVGFGAGAPSQLSAKR